MIRKWAGRVVTILGVLTMIVGCLIGFWAPVLGHREPDLAMAIMVTGWLGMVFGYLIHGIDEPW